LTRPDLREIDTTAVEMGDDATTAELPRSAAVDVFAFSAGEVLAGRYRVLKRLGRGGMGEVWRAYDLKLRVDVALKSLNAALAGARGLELMRGEVRAAREVISPNVCRIFDLIEIDGHELVSMEFVDGHTLVRTLDERGPLDVQEAADIGSQLLAGLEAIHAAGLVHRDIKPENIMLTRSKRVVVMDFGLTAPTGEGMHAGTPAYMAPEQGRGEATDARADVFSAGIVLAELLSVGGDAADAVRHSIWTAIREVPPSLPDVPWQRVLLKAIATAREDRYESASDMARTLEKVSVRVEGAEDKTPYPGLAAYGADGADFFFGREAEVETLWKKLQHANLLGLIGTSGAGKSSFVHAGLLPARPSGWSHLQFQPRQSPFAALRRALAPELQHDPDARAHLATIEDPDSAYAALVAWRRRHHEVLLVVDQFEELFTQSEPSVQVAFTEVLARAAFDNDVHVLLSMRDDFLMRCYDFPALAPIFSELTPLKPPSGAALRRAVVHPALKCGYRFENEEIVEDMLDEVTRERAALPLIAFTAARLWEERERDTGLLTQDAYDQLGGVAGALAQHAESALDGIGADRVPIVRELLRNLVTAQGTRATADFDDLLSLFHADHQSADAAEVLQALIDARLLTSYEVQTQEDQPPARRVEVVHESLLTAWPRLVRWRSQDADSLQLRDELRQAAKLWDSRHRPDDLLWSGTAYREYRLWRERYAGRLTAVEEAFAVAMTTAGERARRRRQRVVTVAFAAMLIVVAGVTTLWRQSETARLHAEAQAMVMQGTQTSLESYPTAALAWAIKSLEVSDTLQGRNLALRALWKGPPVWQVNSYPGLSAQFSPDGDELLQGTRRSTTGHLLNVIESNGATAVIEGGHDTERIGAVYQAADADMILSFSGLPDGIEYGLWSANERRSLALALMPHFWQLGHWNAALAGAVQFDASGEVTLATFDGTPPRTLANLPGQGPRAMTADATWFAHLNDGAIETYAVDEGGVGLARPIGRHAAATDLAINGATGRVASRDARGEIRIWNPAAGSTAPGGSPPITVVGPPGTAGALQFSRDGAFLTFRIIESDRVVSEQDLWAVALTDGAPHLRRLGTHRLQGAAILDPVRKQVGALARPGVMFWHRLASPDGAQGLELKAGGARQLVLPSFHPSGDWVAAQHSGLSVWSLARPYPIVIPGAAWNLAFGPDGNELVARALDEDGEGGTFSWPLDGAVPKSRRLTHWRNSKFEMSPDGRFLAYGGRPEERTSPLLVNREDGTELLLPNGFVESVDALHFSPDSKLLVAVGGQFLDAEQVVRVWDVASGELVAEHDPAAEGDFEEADTSVKVWYLGVQFAGNRQVVWSNSTGTFLWDLDRNEHRQLGTREYNWTSVNRSGSMMVGFVGTTQQLFRVDIETGVETELSSFGTNSERFALSPDGNFLAAIDNDGVVRVGAPTTAEPHLMFSHVGRPTTIALDPQGRWVATGSADEIRLWPMPDLTEPPLHTLAYDELLAKLRTLTNVRLVEDVDSPDGWSVTFEPFPGWQTNPIW
jgi:WD40 repeat protein